jgi:phosphoglycolate phosphatase
MSYSLIVFDWDGTLIDSAGTIVECIRQASADLGLEVPDRERASHVIGLGLHDSLRLAVPGLPAERYGEFAGLYRKHFLAREDAMRLFPGVEGLLKNLSQTRRLAIATGKSRRGLERALRASALGGYFSASRCADETTPKPDPAMLQEIMAELSTPVEHVLMIGDTSHDMEMARGAGVDALAVTYGAHAEPALRACHPQGCVSSVTALGEWLERNA